MDDKMEHKAEELGGKAKEALGKATDDKDLEAEGHGEQTKANLKQAGDKVKDAFDR
jgi:uncharacterized protein YjbJ (UPF0337 family)